jgi:hypothetical protein
MIEAYFDAFWNLKRRSAFKPGRAVPMGAASSIA